jgi:hypothetical protein
MLSGHSSTIGGCTFRAGAGVSPAPANLSSLRPDTTPHQSTALACLSEGTFTTNSRVVRMISKEYRSGRTEIDSMGGSLQTFPAHAIVIRFGFHPSVPPQLTRTGGAGERTFPGFQDCFSMGFLFAMPCRPFPLDEFFEFLRMWSKLSFPHRREPRLFIIGFPLSRE